MPYLLNLTLICFVPLQTDHQAVIPIYAQLSVDAKISDMESVIHEPYQIGEGIGYYQPARNEKKSDFKITEIMIPKKANRSAEHASFQISTSAVDPAVMTMCKSSQRKNSVICDDRQ